MTRESDSAPVTVKVARSKEEVESLRGIWSSWHGQRETDIDLFLMVCGASSEVVRPHVLVLYRGDTPVAILAGRIVHRRLKFTLGYFVASQPLVDVMEFPYGALRGDGYSENCEVLVREIMTALKSGEADLALFDHVDASSALYHCAKRMSGFFFRDYVSPIRVHRIMELPDSIERLYAGFSFNQRSHFRKVTRRLNAAYPKQIEVGRFRDRDNLDRMVRDCEEVAKKAWQRKFNAGFDTSEASLGFLRLEADKGWIRGYVLYIADKPCAFWIGGVYGHTFYSDFTGYDPEYTRHSPGWYLLGQILEELCTDGVRTVDFMFSEEVYKERICNGVRREATVHIFAPTFKGFSLNVRKTLITAAHESTRNFLERANFTQPVKKVWRKIVQAREKNQK